MNMQKHQQQPFQPLHMNRRYNIIISKSHYIQYP